MIQWKNVTDHAKKLMGNNSTLRQIHYELAGERIGGYKNTNLCYDNLNSLLKKVQHDGIPWCSLGDNHNREILWDKSESLRVCDVAQWIAYNHRIDPWEEMCKKVVVWLRKRSLSAWVGHILYDYRVPIYSSDEDDPWIFINNNHELLSDVGPSHKVKVLLLGDHDPENLEAEETTRVAAKYYEIKLKVERIALMYDQVSSYNLLPNPSKKARKKDQDDYTAKYGYDCWELEALEPPILERTIKERIESEIDFKIWENVQKQNQMEMDKLYEYFYEKLGKHPDETVKD